MARRSSSPGDRASCRCSMARRADGDTAVVQPSHVGATRTSRCTGRRARAPPRGTPRWPGASLGDRPDDGEERFELVAVGRPVVPDPVLLRSVHGDRRSARDPDALFPCRVPLLGQHLEVDAVGGRGDRFEQRALGRRGGARHVGRVVEQGDRVGQPAHPVTMTRCCGSLSMSASPPLLPETTDSSAADTETIEGNACLVP